MIRLLTACAALAACLGPVLAQDVSETEDDPWQAYALHIGLADETTLQANPDMALGEPYVLYGVGMGITPTEAQAMAVRLCGVETCVAMGQPSQTCQFLLAGVAPQFGLVPAENALRWQLTVEMSNALAQGETFWALLESAYTQGMVPVVKPLQVCPFMG